MSRASSPCPSFSLTLTFSPMGLHTHTFGCTAVHHRTRPPMVFHHHHLVPLITTNFPKKFHSQRSYVELSLSLTLQGRKWLQTADPPPSATVWPPPRHHSFTTCSSTFP
ncbi:hypothetical protein I3760_15G135500 [Carya illinoinensis]|nr:hypothetical protein I3760_15G135500 [Carya illinoinensis]